MHGNKLYADERRSATLVPTLFLSLGCCLLAILGAGAAPPSWWQARGATVSPQVVTNNGVVTTNYLPNPYAVATQGQLKQFTARAVDELNNDLAASGGAGFILTNLVSTWQQDYLLNGYATNSANPTRPYKPSDLQVVNVGQLKYIARLIYGQLSNAGYSDLYPSWINQNPATDSVAANLGQLKEVFNFDLSLAGPTGLTASANNNGTIVLSWTQPAITAGTSYFIEQQNVDGSWKIVQTVPSGTSSYAVTNLSAGENPEFQIFAQNGTAVSSLQTTPNDAGLLAPTHVYAAVGAAPGEIDLTWQNQATDATYISIHQSLDNVNWTTVATIYNPSLTSYAVTNLTVGQSYYFSVSAGNN